MKKLRHFAFVIISMALMASACSGSKKIWADSYLGKKAPDLVVEKWLSPPPKTEGKFVLIDFWATWCGPCKKAIPELNVFQQKFRDRLVVIGISDETEEAVRKMTSPPMQYAVAIDTQARTKKQMAVQGIPHIILLDPKGIVRWEGFPFMKGYELTDTVIQNILDQK